MKLIVQVQQPGEVQSPNFQYAQPRVEKPRSKF